MIFTLNRNRSENITMRHRSVFLLISSACVINFERNCHIQVYDLFEKQIIERFSLYKSKEVIHIKIN